VELINTNNEMRYIDSFLTIVGNVVENENFCSSQSLLHRAQRYSYEFPGHLCKSSLMLKPNFIELLNK
jgi:hypothetical protein